MNQVLPGSDNILEFSSVWKLSRTALTPKPFLNMLYLKPNRIWCGVQLYFNNKAYASLFKED